MQNLIDDLMSLDTSGEFMKQWEIAYPGIRAEVPIDLAWGMPAIIDYLTVVLGNFYMRRMISIEDMRAVALGAVRAYVQWACISFGIGLEAGLGRLEDGDVQTCLYVGNQQYVSLLIDLLQPLEAEVKIRSSHKAAEATLIPVEGGRVRIKSQEPQLAITPGQVAVFYQHDTVTGGGIITP